LIQSSKFKLSFRGLNPMVEILELFEYSLGFLSVLTVECRTLAVLTISTGPPAQE